MKKRGYITAGSLTLQMTKMKNFYVCSKPIDVLKFIAVESGILLIFHYIMFYSYAV
jgi:hypothetical protein